MEFFIVGRTAFPVHPGVASQSFCKDNQRYPYGTTRKHFFDHAANHFSSIAGQDSRLPARKKLPPAGNLLIFPYSIRRFKTFFYFCNQQETSRRAQAGNQVFRPGPALAAPVSRRAGNPRTSSRNGNTAPNTSKNCPFFRRHPRHARKSPHHIYPPSSADSIPSLLLKTTKIQLYT